MQPVRPSKGTLIYRPAYALSSALSFWQYQIHQESSYQQSVLKYANEKNAQLQKQLDNVIREGTRAPSAFSVVSSHLILKANGELNLLNNKIQGTTYGNRKLDLDASSQRIIALERDAELEKRKNRDLQEASRERDREYQKLKVCRFSYSAFHWS